MKNRIDEESCSNATSARGWGAEIGIEQVLEVADPATKQAMAALHQSGWSLLRLFEDPLAMFPVAPRRSGPGRVFLFSDRVALVVVQRSGKVEVVLRTEDALACLRADSPELLEAHPWAAQHLAGFERAQAA